MKGPRHLLDASALLALLQGEAGCDRVELLLDRAAIHSFNLAEVLSKLLRSGVPNAENLVASLQVEVIAEFSATEAAACARLHAATRGHGLSMGDCVCLSVAKGLGITAVTAERVWEVAVAGTGTHIECVR